MTTRRKNERGIALIVVALFMAVILGFTVLGIDIARLAHTATEVQSVADAAARGGAKALMDNGGLPGTGIARAKDIAALNRMNGTLAPTADVLVDEGHWGVDDPDTGAGHFEFCTTNTPCAENGSWGEVQCSEAEDCDRVTAVLTTPFTDVDNLLAGVLNFFQGGRIATAAVSPGHEMTRVEKLAIAGPQGPGGGCQVPEGCDDNDWDCYCSKGVPPCLPMTVASCEFDPPNCNGVNCTLPTLQVSSDKVDTAGWTGFQDGHNTPSIEQYLDQGPCGNTKKENDPPPPQEVGGDIDITNGINSGAENQPFGLVECLAAVGAPPKNQAPQGCGLDEDGNITNSPRGAIFTIPVFDAESSTCDPKFNDHAAPVVGFATIEVLDVSLSEPKTVDVKVVANNTDVGAQGGGGCFGTVCKVTMTK